MNATIEPTASLPEPAARIAGARPYRPPDPAPDGALRLDANEGPAPSRVLAEWIASRAPEIFRRYPDASSLEAQLASRFDVDPARVLVTAGADEAIQRLALAMLEPGRAATTTTPTFEMIGRAVRLAGADLREIPWMDGPLPIEAVADAAAGSAVTFAVTPNNPTGSVIGIDDLLKLADATGLLVADLAYAEYAAEDPTKALLDRPNTLVLRTLSKAWGLAGLRVGYAVGPAEVIEAMRAAGGPYTVSAPSLAIAEDWLSAGAMRVRNHVQRVRAERAELTALLAELGAGPLPSEANFVLARFADAAGAHAALRNFGVHVRAFAAPPLRDCLRITCPGDRGDFIRLCRALRAALEDRP
ncbi:MAG: pyridoxal phosphate-dependent aminotransferase [Phycisphaerales bacterium JB039]